MNTCAFVLWTGACNATDCPVFNKMPADKKILVEVISDVICPWCWIGKRNLESAITQSGLPVDVQWRPFLLRPSMPPEGVLKPPASASNPRVGFRLKSKGEAVGINFTGACERTPFTVPAHALLKYASEHEPGRQNALQEVLFRQYFTDGVYPGGDNLRLAAIEAGLDPEKAIAYAQREEVHAEIKEEALQNSASGVSGVPFFIVNGKPVFSGAQPVETILHALRQAAAAS
uniref:DSBA-like thioredoxin domain-containing protein n=1 Tax=Chrysotila carterae TaxID=13221 RepID=A0A7S4B535_CHRCT